MSQQTPLVVVLAKAPVAGRAKTRLTPPCTPAAAAAVARASLLDTVIAVEAWGGQRMLALDSCGTDFAIDGWPQMGQPDGGLDVRLEGVFAELFSLGHECVFLVGMDTPQLVVADIAAAFDALSTADAVIGRATDGGYWCIGFRRWVSGVFLGVPMSVDTTYAEQYARMVSLGLSVATLRELSDIDTFDDAVRVGAAAPATRLGRLVAQPDWWTTAT